MNNIVIKYVHAMILNNINNDFPVSDCKQTTQQPVDDFEHIKVVIRKILAYLEKNLDATPATSEEDVMQQRVHERIFGVKASLAATLVMLAELMIKLEQGCKIMADKENVLSANQSPHGDALSPADRVLIEAFIGKMQSGASVDLSQKQ